MVPDEIPWDVYVDERKAKDDHCLGFLVVPNTASFMHKLFLCRHRPADAQGRTIEGREIHWSEMNRGVLPVAIKWVDCLFQHRGARFYHHPWGTGESKEIAVLRFLARFTKQKKLTSPYNLVVFLDYDSEHAPAKIQNAIREVGRVARCYHLDSLKNDCIQCCDMMLGAACLLRSDPTVKADFPTLSLKVSNSEKLRDSESKRFLAGYLAKAIDSDPRKVYYHSALLSR